MARQRSGCALDALVGEADDVTPHEDMRIFVNICKGVHGVGACEECANFKDGQCGFLVAAGLSVRHGGRAEA